MFVYHVNKKHFISIEIKGRKKYSGYFHAIYCPCIVVLGSQIEPNITHRIGISLCWKLYFIISITDISELIRSDQIHCTKVCEQC